MGASSRSFWGLLMSATLLSSSPAAAEVPAAEPAPATSGSAPPPTREEDTDAVSVPGVTLMIVGGGVALVGATLLVIDASRSDPEPFERGLDPGLGGVRGRAGQLALDDEAVFSPVSAILLGGGALVHLVGVAIVFSGGDAGDDAPPAQAARIEPVLAPGYGGVRGSF